MSIQTDAEKIKETWEREPKFLNLFNQDAQDFWKATGIETFEAFVKAVPAAMEKGYMCQASMKVRGYCCAGPGQ